MVKIAAAKDALVDSVTFTAPNGTTFDAADAMGRILEVLSDEVARCAR